MRDPFKAKTAALYGMLRRAGPMRVTLEEFRGWLLRQSFAAPPRSFWHCAYCEQFMWIEAISIDHRIPVSMGGPGEPFNLAVCCRACNGSKGNMSDHTFTKILEVLSRCSSQERADVLGRLRSGQWRTARARNYKRRRAA